MCNMNELEKGQGSFIVANVLSVYPLALAWLQDCMWITCVSFSDKFSF